MQEDQSLDSFPPVDNDSEVLTLNESSVHSALVRLNLRKASGPDGVPNWRLLKDYAEFLANPVCVILNSSFAEQSLPLEVRQCNTTTKDKTCDCNYQAHQTYLANSVSIKTS